MPRSSAELNPSLRITEVFLSLQGESSRVGLPTIFVRLTGCPLRCQYCDTAYAFSGGEQRDCQAIVDEVRAYGVRHVTVTGGEPLAQPDSLVLLERLCDAGLDVSLETSGALPVDAVDPRVARIVDIKTPGSGEMSRNHMANLKVLRARDEIKFVICDRSDYEWARMTCEQFNLYDGEATVLFSPSASQLPARTLADWIVEDRLAVRFQTQLHKSLWGDEAGR